MMKTFHCRFIGRLCALSLTIMLSGCGDDDSSPTEPTSPRTYSWVITASTNCAINFSTRSGYSNVLVVIDNQELRVLWPDNTTGSNTYTADVTEGPHRLILRARGFDGITEDTANKIYTITRNLSTTMSCSGGNVVLIDN